MDYDKDFAEFSDEEFHDRLTKLRAIMRRKSVDVALLTETENIRWIAGYWTFVMGDNLIPTAVIVPASDKNEPLLIVSGESTGESLSWIKNVKYWVDFNTPDVNFIAIKKGEVLVDTINQYQFDNSTIGLEIGNRMGLRFEHTDVDYFFKHMTHLQHVDISQDLWELRSIKSSAEIDKLRLASKITSDSLVRGLSNLREGMTERELGQFFVKDWFEHGATGIGHVGVTFPKEQLKYAHADPRPYPLERGEIAKCDIGCTFEGYRSDLFRMGCVGQPNSSHEARVASVIKDAVEVMIENIKAGLRCSDLWKRTHKVFEDAGLGDILPPIAYIGHGIGLSLHEPPFISKCNDDVLRTGMVLSIEPWTVNPSLLVEDVVVVDKDGCEVFSDIPRDIFIS